MAMPQLESDTEDCPTPGDCPLTGFDFCTLTQAQVFCIAQRLAEHAASMNLLRAALPLISEDDGNLLSEGDDGGAFYDGSAP